MRERRNSGLDLIRTSAILLVLALHSGQLTTTQPWLLGRIADYGWAGVDIFFVLSGFLIASQFFSGKVESEYSSVRDFYIKRWLRTLPLYFLVLFSYVVIKPYLGFPFQGQAWHYAFFLQNYTGVKDFIPSWSLCIEEHFYLIFPFLALVWRRWRLPAWVWLLPAAFSMLLRLRFALANQGNQLGMMALSDEVMFRTHLHLDGLALGVFFAASRGTWEKWNSTQTFSSLLAGLLVFFLTLYAAGPYFEGWAIVYCFTGLAIGASLFFPFLLKAKIPRPLAQTTQRIAIWSYGIYIWNDVISRALFLFKVDAMPWAKSYSIFLIASFGVAILTYHSIERPFLLLRQRILDWTRA